MNKLGKRIISLICTMSLLATAFLGHSIYSEAEGNAEGSATSEATLEHITLSDAGYTYDYQTAMGDYNRKDFPRANLGNTLFGMYMRSNVGGAVFYGLTSTNNDNSGIRISQGTEMSIYVFGASTGDDTLKYTDYGMQKDFTQEEFLLQISVEFGDYDEEADKDDIKIGVYINEILCNDKYYYIYDNTEAIGTGLSFWWMKPSYYRSYEPLPTGLKEISLIDAGISDKPTSGGFKSQFNRENLDGTLFGMYMQFTTGDCRFHYGSRNGDDWNGVTLRGYDNYIDIGDDHADGPAGMPNLSVVLDRITPETIGFEGNLNAQEILVQISTEFIDYHKDNQKNDIKLGIFINGQLQKGEYYIIQNDSTYFGVGVSVNCSLPSSYRSYYSDASTVNDFETVWSHRDLNLPDGNYVARKYVQPTGESFANTAFSAYVNIKSGTCLRLGDFSDASGKYNCIYMDADSTAKTIRLVSFVNGYIIFEKTFSSDIAKTDLTDNDNLKLTITTKELGTNAMEIGVYFNDVLYEGKHIYLTLSKDNLPMGIDLETWGGVFLGIKAVNSEEIAPPTNFEYLTLMDEGIADGNTDFAVRTTKRESMDKTLFSVKLMYTVEGSRFHLATGTDVFSGVSFRLENGFIMVSNEKYGTEGDGYLHNMPFELLRLDAGVAGVGDTFVGKEFLLQVSTEFVDQDGDGQKNDIKWGFYINGNLYSGMHFYVKDNAEQLGTCFNSQQNVVYQSYNYQGAFLELTSADFGLKDNEKITGDVTAEYNNESIEATAVTMMMNFPKQAESSFYLGGENQGVRLESLGDGTIGVSYVNAKGESKALVTLEAKTAQVASLTNETLKWRFALRTVATGDNKGVLQLGIYINGQLYNAEYIKVEDIQLDDLKNMLSVSSKKGVFQFAESKYEELTLRDFSILDVDVNLKEEEGITKRNYCDYESLDSSAVSIKISFPCSDQQHRVIIGDFNWRGLSLISYADGTLWLVYVEGDTLKTISYLQPEKAGLSTFYDKELEVRMEFDILKTTEGRADLKLGIYFNGQLYDERPFVVRDISTEFLTRTFTAQGFAGGTYKVKSVEEETDFTKYGFDNNWKKTLGLQ